MLASYPGLPDFSRETLKNMGRPGYEANSMLLKLLNIHNNFWLNSYLAVFLSDYHCNLHSSFVPSTADYAVKTIKWSTTETVRLHVRDHMTPFMPQYPAQHCTPFIVTS